METPFPCNKKAPEIIIPEPISHAHNKHIFKKLHHIKTSSVVHIQKNPGNIIIPGNTSMPSQQTSKPLSSQRLFFHPDYYCWFWNLTKSCAKALADYTANREFHPAPKNCLFIIIIIHLFNYCFSIYPVSGSVKSIFLTICSLLAVMSASIYNRLLTVPRHPVHPGSVPYRLAAHPQP